MDNTDACVIAIDAGTTGVRSRAVFVDGRPAVAAYREFTQHFPQPGWVEHDATEIWGAVTATLAEVVARGGRQQRGRDRDHEPARDSRRVGSNAPARRTAPRSSGRTAVPRRAATSSRRLAICRWCASAPASCSIRTSPGRSSSGCCAKRQIPLGPQLALGTIDAWLIWNLTGGAVHATDVTNASRTMLLDIRKRVWSDELCTMLHVPVDALPEVRPSSGRFGTTVESSGVPGGVPISGVAGDQQAALFGQACFDPGMAKNTYGTGSFVLLNVGSECPPPTEGMLTTLAWELVDGTLAYALEGAIFVTGAAIQWLRDGIHVIDTAAEAGAVAESVSDSGGVYVVPAFTGLGSAHGGTRTRAARSSASRVGAQRHTSRVQ